MGAGMTSLRLELFGGFQLSIRGHSLRNPRAKKARAVLAYLVAQEGRVVSRDQLAGLLWPHSDHQRARHSLSQALSSIRNVLEEAGSGRTGPHEGDGASRSLRYRGRYHEFRTTCRDRINPELVERAAALYTGPFLQGLYINASGFESWQRAEEDRLNEIAIAALQATIAISIAKCATQGSGGIGSQAGIARFTERSGPSRIDAALHR